MPPTSMQPCRRTTPHPRDVSSIPKQKHLPRQHWDSDATRSDDVCACASSSLPLVQSQYRAPTFAQVKGSFWSRMRTPCQTCQIPTKPVERRTPRGWFTGNNEFIAWVVQASGGHIPHIARSAGRRPNSRTALHHPHRVDCQALVGQRHPLPRRRGHLHAVAII
jgi:hypothetical protein